MWTTACFHVFPSYSHQEQFGAQCFAGGHFVMWTRRKNSCLSSKALVLSYYLLKLWSSLTHVCLLAPLQITAIFTAAALRRYQWKIETSRQSHVSHGGLMTQKWGRGHPVFINPQAGLSVGALSLPRTPSTKSQWLNGSCPAATDRAFPNAGAQWGQTCLHPWALISFLSLPLSLFHSPRSGRMTAHHAVHWRQWC